MNPINIIGTLILCFFVIFLLVVLLEILINRFCPYKFDIGDIVRYKNSEYWIDNRFKRLWFNRYYLSGFNVSGSGRYPKFADCFEPELVLVKASLKVGTKVLYKDKYEDHMKTGIIVSNRRKNYFDAFYYFVETTENDMYNSNTRKVDEHLITLRTKKLK